MLELYINDSFIELSDESKIGLTFVSNEIGSIQNKRANFSNQFKVPKTGNNVSALGYPNQLNSTSTLPYSKLPCRIVQDGIEIITNGYAIINDAGEHISVTVYSGNADFFELIKGLKLSDIDLSEFNHTWNLANAIDNIDNQTNEDGYVYGLVAYGESFPGGGNVRLSKLLPSIRCKKILEKIVEQTGFTISGNIYSDSESILHKMVIPYCRNEEQQELEVYDTQLFNVGLTTNSSLTTLPTDAPFFYPYGELGNIPFDDELTPHFDNGGLHSAGKYVVGLECYQKFTTTVNVTFKALPLTGATSINQSQTVRVTIFRKNTLGSVVQVGYSEETFYGGAMNVLLTRTLTVTTDTILVNVGDIFYVNVSEIVHAAYYNGGGYISGAVGDYEFKVLNTSTFENNVDGNLVYGRNLTMSSLLPDMLQSDFIKNILQITCGQIQCDSYSNTLYLTSFQEVSESTTVKDWSEKVNDKTDTIKLHSNYAQNNYLKYKADSSNEVTAGVPNNIGDGVILINDESLPKEATMIQLQFAGTTISTPRIIGSGHVRVMPLVNKVDPSTYYFTLKTEPRILLYERETYSLPVRYEGISTVDTLPYYSLQTTNYTTWFIDTITDRTYQLGFNNNLITTFFQTFIATVTNYKEVEVEVNLTAMDLNNFFDHSIPVYISKYQEKFYVDSINNYQKGKLTKCTLIRL